MAETAAPHRSARHEYVVLDGLRGIAALAVGILHAIPLFLGFEPGILAFLAVDFFFCLSGFVLSFAYRDRIAAGRLGMGAYFAARVQRLYPMIFIGVLLGFVQCLVGAQITPMQSAAIAAGNLFMLPVGLAFAQEAFRVNIPLWSLMFEFVASVIFGRFAGLSLRLWLAIAAISAAVLGWAAYRYGGLTLLGHVGFGRTVMGLPRVLAPFALGVAIQIAMSRRPPGEWPALSPAWPAAALLLVLFSVRPDTPLVDLACALLLLPGIIVAGAIAAPGRHAGILRFLGRLSYPFYAVHDPVLWLFHDLSATWPTSLKIAGGLFALFAAVTLALVLERWYDRPARALLGRLFGGRRAVAAGSRA